MDYRGGRMDSFVCGWECWKRVHTICLLSIIVTHFLFKHTQLAAGRQIHTQSISCGPCIHYLISDSCIPTLIMCIYYKLLTFVAILPAIAYKRPRRQTDTDLKISDLLSSAQDIQNPWSRLAWKEGTEAQSGSFSEIQVPRCTHLESLIKPSLKIEFQWDVGCILHIWTMLGFQKSFVWKQLHIEVGVYVWIQNRQIHWVSSRELKIVTARKLPGQ